MGDGRSRLRKNVRQEGQKHCVRPESEAHGSGFIVDGNSIKGKTANCTIKARKETGQFIHLLASCSTDIMLSEVQFSVKVVNENRLTRIFPGMDGVEVSYDRCAL